jgi:transcriptional regulator with XRE-family HTH domain
MWKVLVTRRMTVKTLGEFINEEMLRRDMGAREFARYVGVSNTIINKFLNHGTSDTYAGKPVGDPSVEFLVKLSKATGTDLATIVALVRPESKADIDVEARLLAQRIAQLPAAQREIIEAALLGMTIKSAKHEVEG